MVSTILSPQNSSELIPIADQCNANTLSYEEFMNKLRFKYENFEGFVVFKSLENYGNAYAKESMYIVNYISNGFIFVISMFRGEGYRPFFNKFIKGKTILEARETKQEKIPLRKIRARGI